MMDFCMRCRGRMCPKGGCILKQRLQINKSLNESFKKDFFGENYNVFVGRFNYPDINVGLLNIGEPKKDETIDNPLLWADQNYEINQIIQLRSGLINSNFKAQIKGFNQRFMDTVKEVSLSMKPTDTEIVLEKKPEIKLTLNNEAAPFGPAIKLEKVRITENVKIPDKVEKIARDDLSARESLSILYDKGFDEHYLTKVFSMGNLGHDTNKKLVPTRWSITAVDDTLGKDMISEVKQYPMTDYQIHFGGYLGNYYIIMFFPEAWSYELFETKISNKEVWHDYEYYHGRKEYASSTVGGYYAARFSILQRLSSMKRQATVLALRLVTDEYWAPLGVWVVREAVKKAMSSKPISFESKEDMIKYAVMLAKERFRYNLDILIRQSVLLKEMVKQKKLTEFSQ
jgi:DNA repair protein NreA